jgi:hypothetical protein
VISMIDNGMMTLQGNPPVATLLLRVTHLLGNHVNHRGEIRKKVSFPSICSIINKVPFATCSNSSIIKATLTMRPFVLCELGLCVRCCYVVDDEW